MIKTEREILNAPLIKGVKNLPEEVRIQTTGDIGKECKE
jgi:hypothetical protein